MPNTITLLTTKESKSITIDKDPSEGNLDAFIAQRISDQEILEIRDYYEKHKAQLSNRLSQLNPQEALQIQHHELPRHILVYLNNQKEVCCLIQLEKYLAGKNRAVYYADQQKLLLGSGANREIHFTMDLHTRDIYAQTINQRAKTQAKELQLLQQLRSPYINPLICYAQYKNHNDTLLTITVSPYQKHGILHNKPLLSSLSNEQKNKLILQLLLGVKSIHDLGKSHNDIKPSNLLIKDNLDLLIIDFDGISTHFSRESFDYTYGYESPEMHQIGLNLTPLNTRTPSLASLIISDDKSPMTCQNPFNHPKNDIFSLGIIIYQIVHDLEWPTIDFINLPKDKIDKLTWIDSLAHRMLNIQRSHRPDINQVVMQFMQSITHESIAKNNRELIKLDAINTAESHSAFFKLLFPGIDDTFEKMNYTLQKAILQQLSSQWMAFDKTHFYKNLTHDCKNITIITNFHHIVQQVRQCIDCEPSSIQDKKHDIQNKLVIRKAIEWLNSNDPSDLISPLKRALSDIQIQDRLTSFYRSKYQATFQAIWLFAISFPTVLNIDFSKFLIDLNKTESSEFIAYLKKNFSLFDNAQLITNNLIEKKINESQRLLLGSLAYELLYEYPLQFRSIEQEQKLIAASIYSGIMHYKSLSIIDKQRVKNSIRLNYATCFYRHYR